MLSEGYAEALTADGWSISSEQRLHELLNNPEVRGRELRSLMKEDASFQRDVVVLRRALAEDDDYYTGPPIDDDAVRRARNPRASGCRSDTPIC